MWLKRESDPKPIDEEAVVDATLIEHPLPAPIVQPRELVLLGEAQRMIMEATSLDEIKDIRDKAEAARKYIESAQLGLLMQNRAAEVKLRAERRAGELLATLKLPGGDRSSGSSGPTLDELGISKHQSSRWQREAAVPDEVFERLVEETNAQALELTTAALLRLARQFSPLRRHATESTDTAIGSEGAMFSLDELRLRGEKFSCIYADPPWSSVKDRPALSTDAISALPIGELAQDNAHLHLWVTNAVLFDGPRVMAAWGFEFQSCLVWVKPQKGPGSFWRLAHEFLLLGTRGELPFRDRSIISWIRINRRRHGFKPEKIRKLIERVSPGPYLQLFGEEPVRGWNLWNGRIDEA